MTNIKKVFLRKKENAKDPVYSSSGAAGADVHACIEKEIEIAPGDVCVVPTGLFFEIPEGFEMQVRPRSGLAAKHAITVLNSPGTIDSDYRGELKVILCNVGKKTFTVEPNMRIAQIVLSAFSQMDFIETEELSSSQRGEGGFGHTGYF